MRVTKKSSSRVTFFLRCRVSPSHTLLQKKITRLDDFFVHAFTAEKRITRLHNFFVHAVTAKKITRCDDFFVTRIYCKKKLHNLPQKKITRCDNFFLHAFTAKIKKLHDLTTKKQLPILLKMHACRQCVHLWATSDGSPALGVGGPRECSGDVALPPSSRRPRRQS